jgi:cell wall-associated NlpC family hydrolase
MRVFILLLFGSFLIHSAQNGACDIKVDYHQNRDGSFTLHFEHSRDCKMGVSLTQRGGDIKFTPEKNLKVEESKNGGRSNRKREDVEVASTLESKRDESLVDKIIATAKDKVGSRYKPGTAGPDTFDCSGFVYYTFKQNGIKVPRVSTKQALIGKKLYREELKKGDIVCFDTSKKGRVNHTGIYLGDGRFIHSTSGRAYSVTVSNLDKGFYKDKFRWGVRAIDSGGNRELGHIK